MPFRSVTMTRILYLVFFASGATGLVYEVIWVRLTGLVFGNTSFSIATVLGAFMAGLALGSWALGRYADRQSRPLRFYGILEILIGLSAVVVPYAFGALDSTYWAVAPDLGVIAGADLVFRFVMSFAIMLVPTFLMGGTLPVLARFFVRATDEVESRLGTLYALNTAGAAMGTLAAALVLIPGLGNQLTTVWIAMLNIGLGLLAIRLDLAEDPFVAEHQAAVTEEPARENPTASDASDRLVLATLAVSGFVAMVYEVSWTRSLSALLGSSTYAFSIMLVTFLIGIAAGSSWASRFRPSASLRMLGLFQLLIALGGLVFLVGYVFAPYLLLGLVRALYYSFPAVLTIQFIMSASLMILATFFMGATFPIAAQLYSSRLIVLGRSIGNAYSVNTVGAIFGSLIAGFLLLPMIGTERTILTGLFLNSALALVLLAEERGVFAAARWAAVGMLLVATVSMRGEIFWDPGMLDRGVLIYSRQFEARPGLLVEEHYADTDIVYFAEGNNASISVRRGDGYVGLRTNGKVDASNGQDMTTQLMIAYLPGFHHPAPENILVIGYGSGVTAGAAAVFPEVVRVDCVEIEPAVVAAGPWFEDVNRRSYDHLKVNIIEGDARNYLNVSDQTYDIIISEPSNPWIAGVGSLFTAEFYEKAAAALADDGIFAQWVQLYELSPEDVRMILAEFERKFPEVTVWDMGVGDLVLLGSRQPLVLDVERMDRIIETDSTVEKDFREHLLLDDPLGILAHYVMPVERVREFAVTNLRNTDDHPLLEFHSPRNMFSETWDLNVALLNEYKTVLLPDNLPERFRERAYLAVMEPLIAMGETGFAGVAVQDLAQLERDAEESLYIAAARLNVNSRQYDAAEESLIRAAELAGEDDVYGAEREEVWALLAETTGDRVGAVQHYRSMVSLDPKRTQALERLAEMFALLRDWDEAGRWMERYVQTSPYAAGRYWAMLGEYLLEAERDEEAVGALETALSLEPYSYLAHLRLAEIREDRGDTEAAIAHLEFLSVYAVDRDARIYTRLAGIYTAAGRRADARRVLEKGARVFPTHTEIYKMRRGLEAF